MTDPSVLTSTDALDAGLSRPSYWTDPDGTPSSSLPVDLFTSPAPDRLVSKGWSRAQGQAFLDHLGREAFHGSKTRDFSQAYRKDTTTGETRPRYYRRGTKDLERCQYVMMTSPQRAAVVIIDIDKPSHVSGGSIGALHPEVAQSLTALCRVGMGPAWVGVNPLNGKAQALWLIDPAYAGPGGDSPNMRLLGATVAELNGFLGGDLAFSHRFSRWPLHVSDDPGAYRWHCQHCRVVRLADLIGEVRTMTGTSAPGPRRQPETYSSGRERLQAAIDARRAAQALAEMDDALPQVEDIAPAASGVVDGVRIIWVRDKHAARDETAFRHALKQAHRLKAAGKPLKDAAIIDAYEHGYQVAQAVGGNGREPDLPPMRDRLTMARRVRGYAYKGVTDPNTGKVSPRQSEAGRKTLAEFGRRGGKATVARRAANPEEREPLRAGWAKANQKRAMQSRANKAEVVAYVAKISAETGRVPTRREIMQEFSVSEATAKRYIRAGRTFL